MSKNIGNASLEIMDQATWYNDWLVSFFVPHLSGDILEIGAGIGTLSKSFSKYGNLTATDFNKSYLPILNKRLGEKASVGYGDIEKGKFDFRNKKFDTIVSSNVIEHIKDDSRAFKNIYSLLRKSGKCLTLVPAHQNLYGPLDKNLGHFRRYSKKSLKTKLEKAGFKVSEIKYLNMLGAIGWYVNSKLGRKGIEKPQLSMLEVLFRYYPKFEKHVNPPFGLSVFCVAEK